MAIIAITLTACGGISNPVTPGGGGSAPVTPGGGGSAPVTPGGGGVPPTPPTPDSLIDVINGSEVQAKIKMVNSFSPNNGIGGSTAQTSNIENASVTADSIATTVNNVNGELTYSVTKTGGVGDPTVISSADDMVLGSSRSSTGTPISSVRLYKKLTDEGQQGQLWVNTYTDWEHDTAGTPMPNANDDDYLAGGIWLAVPDGSTGAITFGVFAGGNDPFTQDIEPLSGTATYNGKARGVYTNTTAGNRFFDADVSLMASFNPSNNPSASSTLGTVKGDITSFTDSSDGTAITEITTVRLGLASIASAVNNVNHFKGVSNGNVQGMSYIGRWGGRFYGNPASGATGDDLQPGSVAGTFGVTNNVDAITGTFGAHK